MAEVDEVSCHLMGPYVLIPLSLTLTVLDVIKTSHPSVRRCKEGSVESSVSHFHSPLNKYPEYDCQGLFLGKYLSKG